MSRSSPYLTPIVLTDISAKAGNRIQLGKLIGLSKREIVIELDNGIRLHFPRIGYVVKLV